MVTQQDNGPVTIIADVSEVLDTPQSHTVPSSTKFSDLLPGTRNVLVEEFIRNAVELVRQKIDDRRDPEEKHYRLFKDSIRQALTGSACDAHPKPPRRKKEARLTKGARAVVLHTSDSDDNVKIARITGYVFRRLSPDRGFTLVCLDRAF